MIELLKLFGMLGGELYMYTYRNSQSDIEVGVNDCST